MNKLISIGYLGIKRCYLNITEEQAIERYCKSEDITREKFNDDDISIDIIEFDNEFGAYCVWE
jgi:hypothetical protein